MAKDVKFNISLKIDGKQHIIEATTDVKELANEMGVAKTKSDELCNQILRFNQVTQTFQNLFAGLQQITGLMQRYTAANAIQQEAETKLANNMRNTMGAREEDIQSIKDLCSAQQQLGVIGDEVQLAGAQELATYLEHKSTLEKLIPVMNDMVAQQYGLNATQESAANIATMLGKVMDGQTGALSRYGYKFDEAQEQILKFGTEEERAAVLAEVVESAVGGMNQALAQTDAGKAKQAANDMGDLDESIGAVFASLEPLLLHVGQLSLALNAVGTTIGGITGVVKAIKSLNIATKVAALAQSLWNKQLRYGQQASIAFASGAKRATVQAIAMRGAILGLMAVTGVGLAFAAVSGIISLFSSNTDDAAESMDEATRAAKRAEEQAQRQKEVEEAGAEAYKNAAAQLGIHKAKLEALIEQKEAGKDVSSEEKKIVGELNDTYRDTMGTFGSVADWYKALVANSEAYCRQMVIEARTRQLANQVATLEQKEHDMLYDENGNKKKYNTQRKFTQNFLGQWEMTYEDDAAKAQEEVFAIGREKEAKQKQLQELINEQSNLKMPVVGSATYPTTAGKNTGGKNTGGGKNTNKELSLIADADTYKELANNVQYYQQQLEKANITDTATITTLARKKAAADQAVQAFKNMTEAAELPGELKTLEDYDKQLQWLRTQRTTASRESIAAIDAEIEKTEQARQALEDESIAALKDDEIQTYEQLNRRLQYFNRLVQEGDEQQRISAQNNINRLNKLQEKWDNVLESAKLPATTDTIRDIDATISFYTARQQREDANQIQKTQAIIDGLERKKRALQLGIEIPSMQREIADIQELTGRERRVKIKGMGFDELTAKIKEMNRLLSDTENSVTADQRKDIEDMISTYERWRKQTVYSFDTVTEGWNGVKGIGDSIQNITDALEGNGNAWQTITGIIDGFIQLYQGIQSIISIIDMFTASTTAHTAAEVADTAAQNASAATAGAEIGTLAAETAAAKAATQGYMELASARYFAAHASIPFIGLGLATGFATAAVAAVQAIGATPFAEGGVVSGPTMALIGEYAGASHNPEVVAPLDKLRNMIQPAGGMGGTVHFEIEGRKLVGVIANETRVSSRSGRRTNIVV